MLSDIAHLYAARLRFFVEPPHDVAHECTGLCDRAIYAA